jgi:anti-sigma B factor antagonist
MTRHLQSDRTTAPGAWPAGLPVIRRLMDRLMDRQPFRRTPENCRAAALLWVRARAVWRWRTIYPDSDFFIPILISDSFRVMTTDASPPSRPEIVPLEGEIDLHQSPLVLDRLSPLIARKLPRIHLDMSQVSYIDSSGLAAFVDVMQRVQAYGGEFALVSLRESVRKIFEISRLDQVFKIYPTRPA